MYRDEIQDRPLGYGLGVKKGNIYGVRGFLRKKGCGKVQRRINLMDNVKEEVTALHEKNDTLEKENEKLKDKVEQNNLLLKTLVGQFSNIVDAVRQGNASPNRLNKKSHILGMANQQSVSQSFCSSFQHSFHKITASVTMHEPFTKVCAAIKSC
uniref:Uncharacterized protein n=1 Tax=Chenopodium quinoa TaxID=63459 RepID=A0A803MWP0_CHEQI